MRGSRAQSRRAAAGRPQRPRGKPRTLVWDQGSVSLAHPGEAGQAARALSRVGIVERLWARTDELSGGQQQPSRAHDPWARVAIARVLIQDREVILADEPVFSVNPSLAVAIVSLLRDESNKTLLMNLHSVELALRYFPRIVALRDGSVLFDQRADAVTSELLQSLYAGHQDDERQLAAMEDRLPDLGHACHPLPGFSK
jgi:ABC-type phosphate/phosphonate transport system ATPase subunit